MTGTSLAIRPIGAVRNDVRDPVHTGWGGVVSRVELHPEYAGMLEGLRAFSHAVVVFWMHESGNDAARGTATNLPATRHPRNDPAFPAVGLLAQRARHRPNPIGVTACRVLQVDADAVVLTVQGLDAIDGTPVLDVKPHVPAFDAPAGARVAWWMDAIMGRYFDGAGPAGVVPREIAPGVVMRSLRPEDVPALHDLWRRAGRRFRPTGRDSPTRLRAECARSPDLMLCAEETARPGVLIGVVVATTDGRKGWINRLAVDRACRRRGIARSLVVAAQDAFQARGLLAYSALVDTDNEPSLALFASLGYVSMNVRCLWKTFEED